MAINKNFVIKNGLEVNTDLLVADFDSKTVGIATTGINNTLQVKGGIGVTNLDVTGIATITNLSVTGVSTFVGLATFGPVGIADSIFHDGDTNTAIRFPEADTFTIETAGSEVVRVTSGGDVGIGTIDPVSADITSALSNNTKVLAVGIVTADQVYSSGIELVNGSLTLTGLTEDRIPIVGAGSTLEDDGNLTFDGSQLVVGGGVSVTGVVTATSFSGSAQIGVGSEHTFIGAGITQINFASTNSTAIAVDVPPATATGIATVTITPGVSLGLAIALGG